jgi:hypothetical protein
MWPEDYPFAPISIALDRLADDELVRAEELASDSYARFQLARLIDALRDADGSEIEVECDDHERDTPRAYVSHGLQQLPRSERRIIRAPEGTILAYVDWRSAHAWIAAALAGDEALWDALASGGLYASLANELSVDPKVAKVAFIAWINMGGRNKLVEKGVPRRTLDLFVTRFARVAGWRRYDGWKDLHKIEARVLSAFATRIVDHGLGAVAVPMHDGALCVVRADAAEVMAYALQVVFAAAIAAELPGAEGVAVNRLAKAEIGKSWADADLREVKLAEALGRMPTLAQPGVERSPASRDAESST